MTMKKRDSEQAQRLRAEVMQPSPLSFDEAQERLPEHVMAELAGEDVDTIFRDVFLAFNHYPELADQYELLLEEMRSDLADPTPVPGPATAAQSAPGQRKTAPGVVLRQLGEHIRGFLIQLMPKPLPESVTGLMSDEPLEYISEWVADRQESVQLTVDLQPLDERAWSLVVLLIPDSETTWQVTATLGQADLPIITRGPYETRFGPLDAVPTQPITLICRPQTG